MRLESVLPTPSSPHGQGVIESHPIVHVQRPRRVVRVRAEYDLPRVTA